MYKRREPVSKVCKHCKTEYMSNHLRQKYCSSSCCTLAFYERNGTEPVKKRSQSLDFNLNNLGVVAAGSAVSTMVLDLFKEEETKLSKEFSYKMGRMQGTLDKMQAQLDFVGDVVFTTADVTIGLGDERVKTLYNQNLTLRMEARKKQQLLPVKK